MLNNISEKIKDIIKNNQNLRISLIKDLSSYSNIKILRLKL